jgi:hypothetical protein
MLSDSPEAVRARRYRNNKKLHAEERHASGTSSSTGTQYANDGVRPVEPGDPKAKASSSSSPLHETQPFTCVGPSAYARPLVLAGDGGKTEPVITAASEPPRPPPTPAEVAGVALAVAAYFEAGAMMAVGRHAEELSKVIDVRALVARMPAAKEFVRAAAERVAIKYAIRIPYQDEAVVAGALGIASYGIFAPLIAKKQTDKQTAQSTPPATSSSSTTSAGPTRSPAAPATARDVTEPPPAREGDFTL